MPSSPAPGRPGTSALRARRWMASRPRGLRMSRATLRLLRLRLQKMALSPLTCFMCTRERSPAPGRSILTTSAPKSPSTCVAHGPISICVKSRTVTPSSGCTLLIDRTTGTVASRGTRSHLQLIARDQRPGHRRRDELDRHRERELQSLQHRLFRRLHRERSTGEDVVGPTGARRPAARRAGRPR